MGTSMVIVSFYKINPQFKETHANIREEHVSRHVRLSCEVITRYPGNTRRMKKVVPFETIWQLMGALNIKILATLQLNTAPPQSRSKQSRLLAQQRQRTTTRPTLKADKILSLPTTSRFILIWTIFQERNSQSVQLFTPQLIQKP